MGSAEEMEEQMSPLGETQRKLAEARFFFALLKRVEDEGPISIESLDDEATFFMPALVSATYSVLQYIEKEGKRALRSPRDPKVALQQVVLEEEIGTIRHKNGLLYDEPGRSGDQKKRGLRHLSVHHKMVAAQHRQHTTGGMYGRARYGTGETVRLLYVLDPRTGTQVSIVPLMTAHLRELEELVVRWEEMVQLVAG